MFEYVVQLFVAALLVMGAYGLKWWQQRIPKNQSVAEALRRSSAIQQTVNQLQFSAKCQRVMLCQAKNGGSLLQPSEPWYSTIVYEAASDELGPKADGWIAQPIDGGYRQLMHEAFQLQCNTFHRDELPRSILRSLYDRDGVESAAMAVISHTPGKIFYLLIEFVERVDDETLPNVEESVRDAVVKFRQLLDVS